LGADYHAELMNREIADWALGIVQDVIDTVQEKGQRR
jgi:hypothetical protein